MPRFFFFFPLPTLIDYLWNNVESIFIVMIIVIVAHVYIVIESIVLEFHG